MNSLNIDCLIEIVKYLQLKDQITFYQINRNCKLAVNYIWQTKYKCVFMGLYEHCLFYEELCIFFESIKNVCETLNIWMFDFEKYAAIRQHCFEKVKQFRFVLRKPYFIRDRHIIGLKNSFPNLEVFRPQGELSGLYMDQWPLLKNLNLSFCFNIEMFHIQSILKNAKIERLNVNIVAKNLKCKQTNLVDAQVQYLQYLEININEFCHFENTSMAALKELIIHVDIKRYNPKEYFFNVLQTTWKAKKLRLLETTNMNDILGHCLETRLNVEQLTIIGEYDPFRTNNSITSLHLLTDMRKLRFIECTIETEDFISLLLNNPQLNEISFEYCEFSTQIIDIRVDKVVAQRTNKLTLNMFKITLIEPQLYLGRMRLRDIFQTKNIAVNVIGGHQLFELTNVQGHTYSRDCIHVVFE